MHVARPRWTRGTVQQLRTPVAHNLRNGTITTQVFRSTVACCLRLHPAVQAITCNHCFLLRVVRLSKRSGEEEVERRDIEVIAIYVSFSAWMQTSIHEPTCMQSS